MRARHDPHAPLKSAELTQQDGPHRKQRLRDRFQIRMTGYQFADPPGKASRCRVPNLEPKAVQYAAQAVLHVQKLRLHQLARREHRAYFLRPHRLAMHRTKPAQPHQLRNATRSDFTGIALKASRTCRVSKSSTAKPTCSIAA